MFICSALAGLDACEVFAFRRFRSRCSLHRRLLTLRPFGAQVSKKHSHAKADGGLLRARRPRSIKKQVFLKTTTDGRIDTHAHYLPETPGQAHRIRGCTGFDGGIDTARGMPRRLHLVKHEQSQNNCERRNLRSGGLTAGPCTG